MHYRDIGFSIVQPYMADAFIKPNGINKNSHIGPSSFVMKSALSQWQTKVYGS